MPRFEIEANGKRYEVEAPTIEAAVEAFGGLDQMAQRFATAFDDSQDSPQVAEALADMQEPTNAGALNAAAGSLIEGLPIVGPAIKGGVDRAVAGARSLTSGQSFEDELRSVQNISEQAREANPISSGIGSVAGGILGTAPAVMAAPAAFGAGTAPLLQRAIMSSMTGGVLGGADAAARSGGDLEAAKEGAAWGLGLGAGIPALGAGAGQLAKSVVQKIRPPAAIPSVDAIKSAATASKDAAAQVGLAIEPGSFSTFASNLGRNLADEGIDPAIHPAATAAFKRIADAATSGTPLGVAETETLRKIAGAAAGSAVKDERRIGMIIKRALDDYIENLKPNEVVSGDPQRAASLLKDYRESWSRARKAEDVSEAVIKAERQAARSGTGGNAENAIRQKISSILDSEKKSRGFTAEEKALMEQIVRGTRGQNALRQVGRLSPTTGGLSAMLNLGATVMNPAMAAFGGAGLAAKTLADRGTRASVDRLDQLIRSGGNIPQSQSALRAGLTAEDIARYLLAPSPLVANQQLVGR